MSGPRVVIGVPLFGHAQYLPEALETLLAQTFDDLALVLCDDGSNDDTLAVATRYAERDGRIHLEANERRLGLAGNWRRAFERARTLHPGAEYFAWGSDHDAWHPRFLAELVSALDARPEAVVAFPHNVRVDAGGTILRGPWNGRGTEGLCNPATRVRAACDRMVPGDMIYGLMRMRSLAHTRFRSVLVPDRLLLSELAMQGEFVEVPRILWHRRFKHPVTAARQRASLFAGPAPSWTLLPWWMPHAAALLGGALAGPPLPGVPRSRRVHLSAIVVRREALMHLRGRVNFSVNRIAQQLDAPRNPAVGMALRSAQELRHRAARSRAAS